MTPRTANMVVTSRGIRIGGADALGQAGLNEDDALLAVIDAAIKKATGDAT